MPINFDPIDCKIEIEKEGKTHTAFNFYIEILARSQEKNALMFLVRVVYSATKEAVKIVDGKCFISLTKFEEVFCQDSISQLHSKNEFNQFKELLFQNFANKQNATFEEIDKKFGRYSKNGCDLIIYHDRIFDRLTGEFIKTHHDKKTYLFYNKVSNFYLVIQNQLSGMGEMLGIRLGYDQVYSETVNYEAGVKALHNLSKNKMLVYSFLGWVIASLYLNEIRKASNELLFPIFMVYGASEQGKTQLMTTLLGIYGAPVNVMGFNTATAFTFEYMLKTCLRTAVYYDEFRSADLRLDRKKSEILRTAPFAGVFPKGAANLTVTPLSTEAGLILTGESPFEEQAETRRAIMFDFSGQALPKDEWNAAVVEWNKTAFDLFRYIAERPFSTKDYVAFVKENKKYLTRKNSDICFGALAGIFGKDKAEEFYSISESTITPDTSIHNADLFFRNVEEYISTDIGKFARKYIRDMGDRIFVAHTSLVKEMVTKRFIENGWTSRDVLGQIKAKYSDENIQQGTARVGLFSDGNTGLADVINGIFINKKVIKETDSFQKLLNILT